MKLTALLFTAAVAVSATPAFADDLCALNLQKLSDSLATDTTTAESVKTQVLEHQKEAQQAQSAGDLETCATLATKALTLLEAPDENG
ncbi:hypothetical protein [Pseudomonas sp. GD03944]|uniref:hypothetical protein n=1 Tax=Pseudomonas sp. GD03944 TaxID=2975409 RepID=UPI002446F4F5|nr:hypothetical protein [Pseudomonas sp. GD03944]MDH1265873.1 hypothetical protein [Pseudomonas sp. GD03944]